MGASGVRVGRITDADELHALTAEWTALADRAGARAFGYPFWCLPWLRRLGRGRPLVLTARVGDELVGLAPFHRRGLAGAGIVRFLGHGLGAVSRLLLAPGHEGAADALWRTALAASRFAELLEYDGNAPALDGLGASGRRCEVRPRDVCPVIRTTGALEDWWAASDSELRRVLRRAERALDADGVSFETELVVDPDRVGAVLPELIAIHDAAEARNPRQHFLAGRWAPFTRDLLTTAAADGRLRLFVGRTAGRPVSFALLLLGGGSMAMWLNRFDPAFDRFSPGHLTLRAVVEAAFAEGVPEVDLLLGDARYKRLWAQGEYRTLTVHAATSVLVLKTGRAVLATAAVRRRRASRGR